MNAAKADDDPIDLRLLVDVPGEDVVPVTRAALREVLEETHGTPGRKRRLSPEAHIEVALRRKRGEPATWLGRAYNLSSVSVAYAVMRVERAALWLSPEQTGPGATRVHGVSGEQGAERVDQAIPDPPAVRDGRETLAERGGPVPSAGKVADRDDTVALATGPFLHEILDAIRPLAERSHATNTVLLQVAAHLERIAKLMRRRVHQVNE